MELGDAPAIHAYQSDAEIYRYMSPEPPASLDALTESIRQWLELEAEDRRPPWVIVPKETGRVAGLIGLDHLNRAHSGGWLDFQLARRLWGKGITTEAVHAVLGYGFATLGLNRIGGYCWEDNMASRRVMEKAGMHYEGTLRQLRFAKGAYRDLRYYSMLAEEWRTSQRLQAVRGDTADHA